MSESSSPIYKRRGSSRGSNLSLDLSNLPSPQQPTPPTNTLLITNLNDTEIFRPDNLQAIRDLMSQTAFVCTWSPLKSFRRIVVSFPDEHAAAAVRAAWNGKVIMGEQTRVYYGSHTPIDLQKSSGRPDNRLELPDAGKLFFISPPPSPPHGWEVRLEDAPNKQVHADDLADALAKLHHRSGGEASDMSPVSPTAATSLEPRTRSRSSTLIYQPADHGNSPNLPAISVDDMTDSPTELGPTERPILAHTAMPPVELMQE